MTPAVAAATRADLALVFDAILVSAGKRGVQIELAPADLVRLTSADTRAIAR